MSEGEELAAAEAGKLGLFKAVAGFFRKAFKLGAEDAGKDVEQNLQKDLEQDLAKDVHLPTKEMNPRFAGENVPGNSIWGGSGVKYLTDEERGAYQLFVKDGKLYDANGNLFDTSGAMTVHSGQGRAIFVMAENGDLYASNYQEIGAFHHSSLLAGDPVAGAGELQVSNGEIQIISDKSGHYMPTRDYTMQTVNYLRSLGLNIADGQIEFWSP
jgi:hypothetical protein